MLDEQSMPNRRNISLVMSKRPDQYSIKFGLSATVEPNTLRSLFVILVATVFENVVAFLFMKTLLITLTELILRKGYNVTYSTIFASLPPFTRSNILIFRCAKQSKTKYFNSMTQLERLLYVV